MNELGAVESETRQVASALRSLRARASSVLPGLYAWLTTVALPSVQRGTPVGARLSAFLSLVALVAAPLFAHQRPLLGRALGIFAFVGFGLLTWLLLGKSLTQNLGDPLLSALGAVAFMLYALGWGSLRRRDAVPEDGPNVIAGPPLQPRIRPRLATPIVFGVIVAAALLPVFLAFRVAETGHALLAHAAAILAAISTITVGARVALSVGQRRALPQPAERLNAAAIPLALLALIFGLGLLWLVVR